MKGQDEGIKRMNDQCVKYWEDLSSYSPLISLIQRQNCMAGGFFVWPVVVIFCSVKLIIWWDCSERILSSDIPFEQRLVRLKPLNPFIGLQLREILTVWHCRLQNFKDGKIKCLWRVFSSFILKIHLKIFWYYYILMFEGYEKKMDLSH